MTTHQRNLVAAVLIGSTLIIGLLGIKGSGARIDPRVAAVDIVRGGKPDGLSTEKQRRLIHAIATSHDISVAEAERQVARQIHRIRALAIQEAGGYGPGVHIVKDGKGVKWDPSDVEVLPAGQLSDASKIKEDKNGQLKKGKKLLEDKDRYIDPIDVAGSTLGKADDVGYALGGVYLNGPAYASTKELKEVEQTPTGRSGWTQLTRVYQNVRSLGDVVLEESDNTAARIAVRIPDSFVNTSVTGLPATLIRSQDGSGRTMTSLRWVAPGGKTYGLVINQIDNGSVRTLMELAETLAAGHRPIG